MSLLFDHNISPRLATTIADIFPHATHVSLVDLDRETDLIVWQYAQTHGLTIVTKDSDFSDISVLRGFPPKVIWLRVGNCSTAGSANRIDELVIPNAQRRDQFCAEIASLDPFALDDIDLASRDGLGLRCDCWRGADHHTIWMHSPTLEDTPRHAQLVAALVTLAADACSDPDLQSYLHALQRYLHS